MRPSLASFALFALASVLSCTPPTLTPTVFPPASGSSPANATPLPEVTLEQCGPTSDPGPVYLEAQVTTRPSLIRPGRMTYPERLRADGISGRVRFAFVIDTAGKVVLSSIRTLEVTDPGFLEPSRWMLLGSRFHAGILEGHPVAVCTSQKIVFTP